MSNGKNRPPKIDISGMDQAFAIMANHMVPGIVSWYKAMLAEGMSQEHAFESAMLLQQHLLNQRESDDQEGEDDAS